MSHGGHGGHGDMPAPSCSMNMLWNTQVVDTCVVFRSWHISGTFTFLLSFLFIVFLGITYEWLRQAQRDLDVRVAARITGSNGKAPSVLRQDAPNGIAEDTFLLAQGPKQYRVPTFARLERALLYGTSTFLSFFLMLIFMTYNAYLILAVVVGATIGHFIYGAQLEADAILLGAAVDGRTKGVGCC